MQDPVDIQETQSIATAISEYLVLYRRLYSSLTGPDCPAADQVDVPKLQDNYGRLNVWASESGALHTGKGSLDDILHTRNNLRSIVFETIGDLTESLKRGMLAPSKSDRRNARALMSDLATLFADGGTNEDCPVACVSDDDSDDDSLSSVSTEDWFPDPGSGSRSKNRESYYLFSAISMHVQSLYKISVSLRRIENYGRMEDD